MLKLFKRNKNEIKLIVDQVFFLSKNVKRIKFKDSNHLLFKKDESAYLKLFFNQEKTLSRSFTIREIDECNHIVTIDFVFHASNGPAANWLSQVKINDVIFAGGPGPTKLVNFESDWFILIGDLTALPAISVILKKLAKDAFGYVIIEIGDETDIQKLKKPEGLHIDWLINNDKYQSAETIIELIEAKPWLKGKPYLWVASEFDNAKSLRSYFKNKHNITKNRYISSYWKIGADDTGNKIAKKEDGDF